jgi:hypothetical protein
MRLFKREAAVTLVRPLNSAELSAPIITPNAIVVRDLRVVAHIEKTARPEPNQCEVIIYNLAERTRKEVTQKPLYVRIDAGYDGSLSRLFTGDLRWSESVHERVTWSTRLQLGDGERSFRFGRLNRSYRAGIDARTAVAEAAKEMGLTVKLSEAAELELRSQFAGGLTMTGPAHRGLSQVLDGFGMNWSIQDSELQILMGNETAPDQVIVVSQDTGMVGTPTFGAPPEKGKSPVVTVTMLLEPRLKVNGRILLKSRNIEGLFKVQRVVHDIDSHGDPWFSTVEATRL